ncbi:DMT family transporter [Patescibacteria group bacterium]|nr:DMT family transporter [Patescibacteria group bacterium]
MFHFLKNHKKLLTILFFTAIGLFVFGAKGVSAGPIGEAVLSGVGYLVYGYVWVIGQLLIQMIKILVGVASYNNFVTSGAVENGWAIVRDIVNMFFIVVLLVIAFGTIFNVENYKYQKMLPRLLIMAVVINFSRTICGIFIDFGQVIMLTFVNGFQAAAGGNFVNALKIDALMKWNNPAIEDKPPDLFKVFAAFLLAAIMVTVALVVITAMVIMLVMRMVVLWFLIILSPLAFMASVWPSGRIKQKYGQWWDMFLDNIMVGPLLAFFLWLSLLVLGSGTVATDEKITPSKTGEGTLVSSNVGYTEIGTEENMISYIMGIMMLLGSLYMAQNMRSAGGGIAGAGLGMLQKYSKGAVRKAGMAPVRGARKAAGAAYERSGMRARLTARKVQVQESKFGKAMGLGTKEYKEQEYNERTVKALMKRGKKNPKLRNLALSQKSSLEEARSKKLQEETGGDSALMREKLKNAVAGSVEKGAALRALVRAKGIKTSNIHQEVSKAGFTDRKDEERLERQLLVEAYKGGDKKALLYSREGGANMQENARKILSEENLSKQQSILSNLSEGVEMDATGEMRDGASAELVLAVDSYNFSKYDNNTQRQVLDALVGAAKNDPNRAVEYERKFNELRPSARAGLTPHTTFTNYTADRQPVLTRKEAMRRSEEMKGLEREKGLEARSVDKDALTALGEMVRKEEETAPGSGRQWVADRRTHLQDLMQRVRDASSSGDAANLITEIDDAIRELDNKAASMDTAGIESGAIDESGNPMLNVELVRRSRLRQNLKTARDIADNVQDPGGVLNPDEKRAMSKSISSTNKDYRAVSPRLVAVNPDDRPKYIDAANDYSDAAILAVEGFEDSKAETNIDARREKLRDSIRRGRRALSKIRGRKSKKLFDEVDTRIVEEANLLLAELKRLKENAPNVSNDEMDEIVSKIRHLNNIV